jgi:hypothetical protein
LVDHLELDDHLAALEVRGLLAASGVGHHDVGGEVVEQQDLTPQRGVELDHGRQRLGLDPDQFRGVSGSGGGLGHDGDQRLAHEPDPVRHQQRPVRAGRVPGG